MQNTKAMASDESVEAWEAVIGQAEGEVEPGSKTCSSSCSKQGAFLPFIFSLVAKDAYHLSLCVSDFHSQTWQEDFSVRQLQDLREDVGIGNDLGEFLTYLRSAFSSKNVVLFLGGIGDAASGKISAQKIRGSPFVSLRLRKLEGSAADDAKASIALGNFRAFLALSSAIASEQAQVGGLKAALAAEVAKTEKLQEQIDASNLSFRSRNKLKRTNPPLSASASQHHNLLSSQDDTQVVVPSLPAFVSGTPKVGKEVAVPKAAGNNSRVHVAPPSRRVKQRGTVIRESTDA